MTPPLERSTTTDAYRHHLAWATWPADRLTPVGTFLSLRAAGHRPCLLESLGGPERLARYSFIGVDSVARLRAGPSGSNLQTAEGGELLPDPAHEALRLASRHYRTPAAPRELPPFRGGWVGWFSYEWASTLEPRVGRAPADPWQVPDAVFDLFTDVVAFDHAAQRVFVIAAAPAGESGYRAATTRIDSIASEMTRPAGGEGPLSVDGEPLASVTPAEFEAGVGALRQAISEGEIYQAVLSQRLEQRFDGDPFTLYRALRIANPAPHMFFFTADDVTLVGSSPERLVAVRDGLVETVPIAGTRPRGEDPVEDRRLAEELEGDVKERAEHDMLVDLARNDLGRVARVGTVAVKQHAQVEKFARVQHLVSRVECRLAPGRDAVDALAACFPAGTVSGAPKVRAMELIARLEPETRGPYAGAFGYLDGAGDLDMAIVIRTLVVRGRTIHLQVGAGVVHDSVPQREFDETMQKASALGEAVRLAGEPAFSPPKAVSA
jgi:anthranilate synthase component 1